MDKKYQMIIAAGLVLVFVVEMIAMGVLGSHSDTTSQNDGNVNLDTALQGTATTNLTINRYSPYVIVKGGDGAMIDNITANLKEKGLVDYTTRNSDGMIVSLNRGRDAVAVASEYMRANASVLATATISMPSTVQVVGDSITTSAEGISFETQLRPVYYEGSHHIATFAVAVQEGRIIGVGTPSFKQEEFIGVFADAEIVSGQGATYSVEVPWEKRAEGKVFAKAKNAAYTEKSFIEIPANTSQNLLTAIQQLPFVTAVQPGVVSVKNSFVDSGIVTIQFMSVNITPTFPPSIARFSDATNQSALSLIADLEAANISSKLKTDRIVGARLPEYVEANGEKYNTAGMVVYFDGTGLPQNATTVNLTFGFAADGNQVTAIISPKPA